MSEQNKEPMVDQNKATEHSTPLSAEALNSVAGGKPASLPVETVSISYTTIQWEYTKQD
jgi:hypothetical protein